MAVGQRARVGCPHDGRCSRALTEKRRRMLLDLSEKRLPPLVYWEARVATKGVSCIIAETTAVTAELPVDAMPKHSGLPGHPDHRALWRLATGQTIDHNL